jgi:hypothetical protein
MVIDLASGKVYRAVKSIKQRLEEAESACGKLPPFGPALPDRPKKRPQLGGQAKAVFIGLRFCAGGGPAQPQAITSRPFLLSNVCDVACVEFASA